MNFTEKKGNHQLLKELIIELIFWIAVKFLQIQNSWDLLFPNQGLRCVFQPRKIHLMHYYFSQQQSKLTVVGVILLPILVLWSSVLSESCDAGYIPGGNADFRSIWLVSQSHVVVLTGERVVGLLTGERVNEIEGKFIILSYSFRDEAAIEITTISPTIKTIPITKNWFRLNQCVAGEFLGACLISPRSTVKKGRFVKKIL